MQMLSGYPSVYQWQMVKVDWKSGKQFCSMTLLAHKSHIAPFFQSEILWTLFYVKNITPSFAFP